MSLRTISLMCSETSVLWWLPWMPMSLSLSYFYLPITARTYCVEEKTMCCTFWILLVMNIEIRALLSIPIRNFSTNFVWYMENNIIEYWWTEIVFLLQLIRIPERWRRFLESLMNLLVLLECFCLVKMLFSCQNAFSLWERGYFDRMRKLRIWTHIWIHFHQITNIQSEYRTSQPNTPWKWTDRKLLTPFRRAYIKRNSSSSWKLKQIE